MTIVERVKTAKDQREAVIEAAMVDAAEGGQLPLRVEEENDGTVRIFFPYGSVFIGRWDHTGDRSAYVGTWFMRPRFDA